MRLSLALLLLALAGVLGGAWLIGRPEFGGAVIFDSLAVGWLALQIDDGTGPAQRPRPLPGTGSTVQEVLGRARNAS